MPSKTNIPLVSVVIPSYNHARYIKETIASVCSQSWAKMEIILVDDGSQDNTLEILDSLHHIDSLRVYRRENQGTAAALNFGLSQANGEYIAILNSDDRFHQGRVEKLHQSLVSSPDQALFSFSRVQLIDQEGLPVSSGPTHEWLEAAQSHLHPDTPLALALLRDNFACTSSNFFFHRSVLDRVGGFRDFRYVNDLDFLIRCLSTVGSVYCQETLLDYRIHDANTMNERFGENAETFFAEWGHVVAGYLESELDFATVSWEDLTSTVAGGDDLQLATVFLSLLAHRKFGQSQPFPPEIAKKISSMRQARQHLDWLINDHRNLQEALAATEAAYLQLATENARVFEELTAENARVFEKLTAENAAIWNDLQKQHQRLSDLEREKDDATREVALLRGENQRITGEREYFADHLHRAVHTRRFRLFDHLSGLRSGQRPAHHVRELIKILLPPRLLDGLRHYRDRLTESADKAARHTREVFRRYFQRFPVPRHHGPLVSIIVPCYNYGRYLNRMLASLDAQTWRDFEVIIVDDGSTEPETIAFIDKLISEPQPGRIVLRQKNSGVIAARNYGISFSSGKYLFPLDPDDTIDKTFLEKTLFYLEHSPPQTFAYTWTYSTGNDDFVWHTADTDPLSMLDENRCGFAVFPRSSFDKTGGYNHIMAKGYEDWEYCVHLVRRGYSGKVIPEPLYWYYVKPGARNDIAQQNHTELQSIINSLHRPALTENVSSLRRRMSRQYHIVGSRVNLDGKPISFFDQPQWLDLTSIPFEPVALFARLLNYAELSKQAILVTVPSRWARFFSLNSHPRLYVYHPENYHPEGKAEPFLHWLQEHYQPQPITVEDLADWSTATTRENARLALLYVGPWLITGGADTMTVDWFRHLSGDDCRLFYATTLRKENVWIDKIRENATALYELPELGVEQPAAIAAGVIDLIRVHRIDILHIMNSPPLYQELASVKQALPNLKIVAQFHCFDYLSDGTRVGYSVDVPARLDPMIDCYNVESVHHQKEIQELYPQIADSKFRCIYGCIDTGLFDPEKVRPGAEIAGHRRADCLNILFIGRLDRQKQPLVMIQVAKALHDCAVPFHLHVVGDGSLESQKDEVLNSWRENHLEPVVSFHGDQPLSTMPSWHAISDILLLTSLWEGIPIVLYQAMAMGRVCVAPRVGGIDELLAEDCGVVIDRYDDIAAYAQAIRILADNPDYRLAMGSRARKRITDNFDISSLRQAYLNLYHTLMEITDPNG